MPKLRRRRPVEYESSPEPDSDGRDIEADEGPPSIDPYEVLGLDDDADDEAVKKAYRKAALANHPDKVQGEAREVATKKFQEIAFAYAILSDKRRRNRYDLTGSTEEVLDDDEEFNWLDFYRAQYADTVTDEKIGKIKNEYKGSDEERESVLDAYTKYKGDLGRIYSAVMLSDILEDDDRFRAIIDEEIEKGTIDAFPKYTKETDATRQKAKDIERKRREKFDEKVAKKEKTKGKSKAKAKASSSNTAGSMDDLAALIQQRQRARAGAALASFEERYMKQTSKKRGAPPDEPPEEAFAKNAKKQKQAKKAKEAPKPRRRRVSSDEEEDDDEVDHDAESDGVDTKY